MELWSMEAEEALRAAGWHPGRQVDVELWRAHFGAVGLFMHAAAERFLGEFGGLAFELSGPGITAAKGPFELDPVLCDGEDDRFSGWGDDIDRSLFPIGVYDRERFFLGMDENGYIYLVADFLSRYSAGVSGLEELIIGVMPERLDLMF